jgi:hypothetical protein
VPSAVTSSKLRSRTSSWVKAIVPSGLICCGLSYGRTAVTPSLLAAKSEIAVSRSRTAGSSTPWGALITIVASNPAVFGALASSSCWTSFVSLSGSVKSVL